MTKPDARSSNGTPLFKTSCPDCGVERLIDARRQGGPCRSCSNKRRATHGLVGTPLFKLLNNIKSRCYYSTASGFKYYGGRGIRVCDEWLASPQSFVDWAMANGYSQGLELDRKDNDGPYAPWNCQFITHAKNSQKRRNARCDIEAAKNIRESLHGGMSVRAAAEKHGVPYMVVWHIKKGNTWKSQN